MAQRTLLQIIQQAQAELGLPQAASVVGNSDLTTTQMFNFANQEIENLFRAVDGGWKILQKEFNLIVPAPLTFTGNLSLNSPIITGLSPVTTPLAANLWSISAPNLPTAARILTVDSTTQVTATMESTAAQTGATILFIQDTFEGPLDYDYTINRTWWDRTNHWELLGPDSPQLDQWHRSGIVATGPRRHFRWLGENTLAPGSQIPLFRLWPPTAEITNPIQLVFEYVSNSPIYTNGTTSVSKLFANDADIPLLNDRAIIMGIKWRFWQQKGFDWTMLRSDYDNFVDTLISRDGGRETLNLVQRVNPIFISPANVQDGFFPGPVGPNTG